VGLICAGRAYRYHFTFNFWTQLGFSFLELWKPYAKRESNIPLTLPFDPFFLASFFLAFLLQSKFEEGNLGLVWMRMLP